MAGGDVSFIFFLARAVGAGDSGVFSSVAARLDPAKTSWVCTAGTLCSMGACRVEVPPCGFIAFNALPAASEDLRLITSGALSSSTSLMRMTYSMGAREEPPVFGSPKGGTSLSACDRVEDSDWMSSQSTCSFDPLLALADASGTLAPKGGSPSASSKVYETSSENDYTKGINKNNS
jgi:hypothetical protein